MQYIKDIEGDEWYLDLNLGNADRLDAFTRDSYQIDLFDAVAVMGLLSRPTNVVSFASCLCADQRKERNLSPEQFGRRWKGEQAYQLQRALWEEYRLFFPDPKIQDVLSSMMKQYVSLSESEGLIVKKALEQLAKTMSEAVEEMKLTIEQELSS